MVPAIKAMEVITIGRRRRRHASSAASMMPSLDLQLAGKLDDQNGVFTGQAHQDHQTHLHEDVVIAPVSQTPNSAESIVIGTIRITASGRVQLSYSAASTRNASSTATGKTISAVLPGGLLEAEIRPLNIHPIRQDLLRQLFQMRHRLRRREDPRIGIANQVRRRITVVADHRIRPVGGTDIHHTADRYHFALIIAGAQIGDIFRSRGMVRQPGPSRARYARTG